MSTINYLQGYAFAKKKGDTIHVFEGPHTLLDFAPVIAEGTDVPRMLKDRFADVVNVRDFGAKGDGATDDTAAIQAADAEAFSSSKTVYFPSGIYPAKNLTMTASWNMDAHSWIRFNGGTSDVVVTCTTDNVVGGNIQIDGDGKHGRRGGFAVSSCGEPQGESKNDKRKRKSQQIHCGGTSAPVYAAGRTDSLCRRIFRTGRTWKAASEKRWGFL